MSRATGRAFAPQFFIPLSLFIDLSFSLSFFYIGSSTVSCHEMATTSPALLHSPNGVPPGRSSSNDLTGASLMDAAHVSPTAVGRSVGSSHVHSSSSHKTPPAGGMAAAMQEGDDSIMMDDGSPGHPAPASFGTSAPRTGTTSATQLGTSPGAVLHTVHSMAELKGRFKRHQSVVNFPTSGPGISYDVCNLPVAASTPATPGHGGPPASALASAVPPPMAFLLGGEGSDRSAPGVAGSAYGTSLGPPVAMGSSAATSPCRAESMTSPDSRPPIFGFARRGSTADIDVSSPLKSLKPASGPTPSSRGHTDRYVVVMVGLPARGKTFLARKVCRFLNWQGIASSLHNVGDFWKSARSEFITSSAFRDVSISEGLDTMSPFTAPGGMLERSGLHNNLPPDYVACDEYDLFRSPEKHSFYGAILRDAVDNLIDELYPQDSRTLHCSVTPTVGGASRPSLDADTRSRVAFVNDDQFGDPRLRNLFEITLLQALQDRAAEVHFCGDDTQRAAAVAEDQHHPRLDKARMPPLAPAALASPSWPAQPVVDPATPLVPTLDPPTVIFMEVLQTDASRCTVFEAAKLKDAEQAAATAGGSPMLTAMAADFKERLTILQHQYRSMGDAGEDATVNVALPLAVAADGTPRPLSPAAAFGTVATVTGASSSTGTSSSAANDQAANPIAFELHHRPAAARRPSATEPAVATSVTSLTSLRDKQGKRRYIKIIDSAKCEAYGIKGFIPGRIAAFVLNLCPKEKSVPVFFSRHGQSEYNLEDRLGGNPNLTAKGREDAVYLREFVESTIVPLAKEMRLPVEIWTSQLSRTIQTAAPS